MNNRRVWKENNDIYSENVNEIDNSKSGGGKLEFTRKLKMDELEAKRQYTYLVEGIKKAKSDLESLKNSITREGLSKFQEEQRKKMKNVKTQLDEYEDLKTQYENVGIHEKAELQQQNIPSV